MNETIVFDLLLVAAGFVLGYLIGIRTTRDARADQGPRKYIHKWALKNPQEYQVGDVIEDLRTGEWLEVVE